MKRFLIGLFLLCLATEAMAATYYVGTSGSDGNSCATATSSIAGNRKLTIAAGLACLSAGDTLIVGDGTYAVKLNDGVPSGASDAARTTVRSENPLGAIIRPGAGSGNLWLLSSPRSYITIDGIDFDGVNCQSEANGDCAGFGISSATDGAFQHITIQNNRFRNIGSDGITTSGVDNLKIINNILDNVGQNNNGLSHGVYVAGSLDSNFSTRVTISGNRATNCGGYCYHLYSPASHREVIVTKNFAKTCGTLTGQGCYVVYANEAVISYNVAANANSGVEAAGFLLRQGSNQHYHNNVVYNSTNGIYADFNNNIGATCKNNLVISVSVVTIRNCGNGTATNITSGTAASHFVNAASDDFSLISSSTAINGGTSAIGTVTFGGVPINITALGNTVPDVGVHQKLGAVSCVVENATPTLMDCTVRNDVNPNILPATGITGWTVTGKTISTNDRLGTNSFRITVTVGFSAGTCALSYAQTGNLTDSALIGNSSNQELFAGAATCTNNVSGGAGATVTQSHAAMFTWDGNEGSGPQIGATNSTTALRAMTFGKFLARLGAKTTVADTPATNYALRYSKNGGAYATVPTFTGTEDVGICDAPGVSSGNTTQRLTSGSYVAGRVVEVGAGVPTITMTNGQSTELLYPICYGPNLVAGTDNIKFRLYKDDGTALAYDTNATLNVDVVSPGLSGL